MFVGLGTISAGPFLFGLFMAVGVLVLIYRIARFQIGHLTMSLIIWYALYNMHGGSTEGGLAVMMAAIILDIVAVPLLRFWSKK